MLMDTIIASESSAPWRQHGGKQGGVASEGVAHTKIFHSPTHSHQWDWHAIKSHLVAYTFSVSHHLRNAQGVHYALGRCTTSYCSGRKESSGNRAADEYRRSGRGRQHHGAHSHGWRMDRQY